MQIPIEDIIVKRRIRKELGDIDPLAESLRRYGLMNPILVNKKNVLLAGRRRLEAARVLGWRTINAVVVEARDELSKLELEMEENLQRRDFTPEETAAGFKRLRKLRNPGFFRRIWMAVADFFRRLFRLDD